MDITPINLKALATVIHFFETKNGGPLDSQDLIWLLYNFEQKVHNEIGIPSHVYDFMVDCFGTTYTYEDAKIQNNKQTSQFEDECLEFVWNEFIIKNRKNSLTIVEKSYFKQSK